MENDQIEIIESDFSMVEDSETIAKLNDIIENIELLKIEFLKDMGEGATLKSITQKEYCAFLMYVRDNYIRPTKCIYKYYPGINNNHRVTLMLDDDLLYCLVDYYIVMSLKADKVCNQMGINALTGLSFETISRLEKAKDQRPRAYETIKNVNKWYEYALEVGAQTGKNPVGYMATLNHRFKWSDGQNASLTVNITRNKDEIMSSVNPELIGKND